ncbi:MAG: hypothetical protein LUF01_09665 [Bacteroides sp.]|nr:hypothetical protein [Bacteroides sp.]
MNNTTFKQKMLTVAQVCRVICSVVINQKKVAFLLLLLCLLASCSRSDDINKNCSYLPVIVDESNVLSAKTHMAFKNADYPLGIVPVLVGIDSISAIEVASYADAVFDSIASNSLDRKAFERRGLLLVVSCSPQLIQVRVGKGYDIYTRMKGATSGQKYIALQKQIGEKGLDEMCPIFVDSVISEIENYRALAWYHKIRIVSGIRIISTFFHDLGTPSNSFFSQFYFRPFLKMTACIYGLTRSWTCSFLLITGAIFLIGGFLKRWLSKKINPDDDKDMAYVAAAVGNIVQSALTLFISFPTIAGVTVLSNARMEDLIVLQAAHIPYLDVIDWGASTNVVPSIWLLAILVVVFYVRYILKFRGYLSLSTMNAQVQQNLYNQVSEIKGECDVLLKGGKVRSAFYYVLVSIFHINSQQESSTANDPAESGNDEAIGEGVRGLADTLFFYTEDSVVYKERPMFAVVSNRHREALVFCFVIMIGTSVLLTVPIILYFVALWLVSTIVRLIDEYKIIKRWRKVGFNFTFNYWVFFKDKKVSFIAFFVLALGILFISNPFVKVVPDREIDRNTVSEEMLEGMYFAASISENGYEGATARLNKVNESYYTLVIYSDMPAIQYDLSYDIESCMFESEILGKGIVDYAKDIDKITIKFDRGWIITK